MVSRVKGEETFLKGRKPKSLDHCWKVVLWEFNSYSPSCIKSSMEVLQKIQNKPLYDPAIPFLDMYLKELKSISRRDICTLMFIAALFTIAKVWKQAKCPTMEIKRKCNTYIYVHAVCVHTHTYNGRLCNHEKEGNPSLPFATTWIEISWTQKDKYCMISLICGI